MDSILVQARVDQDDIAYSLTGSLTYKELIRFVLLLDSYVDNWDFTYGIITTLCESILEESKESLKERINAQIVRGLEPAARDSEVINESSELIEIVENFLSALKLHHEKHGTGIEIQ